MGHQRKRSFSTLSYTVSTNHRPRKIISERWRQVVTQTILYLYISLAIDDDEMNIMKADESKTIGKIIRSQLNDGRRARGHRLFNF